MRWAVGSSRGLRAPQGEIPKDFQHIRPALEHLKVLDVSERMRWIKSLSLNGRENLEK